MMAGSETDTKMTKQHSARLSRSNSPQGHKDTSNSPPQTNTESKVSWVEPARETKFLDIQRVLKNY